MLNIEHRLMNKAASPCDYESLTVMQKVEVFRTALDRTAGIDLARVLWLKSKSSEVWLERRTNYTRSLAVMSMVGYILGLGDRHPSNLMLDRFTGKILHIDFGDCFEVAMDRGKCPEKIPFRLTRMLYNAMEVTFFFAVKPPTPPPLLQVSEIEGTYRTTCEQVMEVLRQNRDSLVAMLGAFVHDPLISWRLLRTQPQQERQDQQAAPQPTTAHQQQPHDMASEAGGAVPGPGPGPGQAGAEAGRIGQRWRAGSADLSAGKAGQPPPQAQQQKQQKQQGRTVQPPPTPQLGPV
ncbi:unnamed protein product, partial [Discosporangium mesarthrocarpum]